MRNLLTCIIILLIVPLANGQNKRATHWYFGYEAGINFNTSFPTIDTTGKMETLEGSSSISDTLGNLLFYTNGEKVWNKNHIIMPNGNGLLGNQSSSQSSIIVPKPGSDSLYYIFTTDAISYSTRYSIIDISLNNGLGDVTSIKNILLYNLGTEEIAGTMHCNATDYWVTGRQIVYDTLKFYSYLINNNGINNPVISNFYTKNPISNKVGCLTFSQDGNTLCFSSMNTPICIFKFNNQTGQITFQDSIFRKSNENVYSNALSPNGKKLYTTSWTNLGYCTLSQYNLNASNIYASRINIDSVDFSNGSPNGYGFIGQVRLAPDQRIYVNRWHQKHPFLTNPNTYYSLDSIDVINFPNLSGYACNFQRNFLYLNHRPTEIGLPNFISNFSASANYKNNCPIVAGVKELDNLNILKIFPNPFSKETTLHSDINLINASLTITNSLGQTVKQIKNIYGQHTLLKREDLTNGLYILKIEQNNTIIYTDKILVVD